MKALILSGGKGRRLKPFTHTTTKQLLPLANRPILFYIMDMVKELDIKDTGIIISPEWGGSVRTAIGDGSIWDTQITYILQPEPAGLAHAVKIAREFLEDSPFLMVLGDNVYKFNIKDFAAQFHKCNPDALILLKQVGNPSNFGIAELGKGSKVIKVEEKPKQPRGNLALAGTYVFSPAVHQAINALKPSWRGELEITDAIQQLIEMGKEVQGYILRGWWLDTGTTDDILMANQKVLNEFVQSNIRGQLDSDTQVAGRVESKEGTIIKASKIHGPVSIAEDCFIENSLIGPFVSMGSSTKVIHSSVENAIIMENCHIRNIPLLADSIIGKRVVLSRNYEDSNRLTLSVGDDATIML